MELLRTFLLVYLGLIIFFIIQSVTYEIMIVKGYTKNKASLIALIPLGGLVLAFKAEPNKQRVLKSSIFKTFSIKEILLKFMIYAELLFMATIVVVPIIYIIGAAFTNTDSLPLTIWPNHPTFSNFQSLFNDTKFSHWYMNTLGIALINMVVGVVFITGAAYVFARFKFKGKRAGLITILVLQVFPSFMGLIAMFVLFETFGWLGKPLYLSILYIGGAVPFNLWVIKGYLQNVPKELDESAMIDGANKLQIFFHIIMPLSVPILSFVAVSMFMSPWMDYMLPNYLLNVQQSGVADVKDQWTIAVGLYDMISRPGAEQYTSFAAGSLIVAVPITILYLAFQKYLVEGITAGSTKG